ncbi:MAG: L-rhamnose mutarotase [Hymenobacter sp.]|nr:MAG: L-rhamnose mutarotase [Hymenobacter sp.]
MQKAAFLMRLKPGHAAEYERRHADLWPELAAALTAAGIREYFIFLEPSSGWLVGVQNLAEGHTAADLPALPLMRRWWDYMADLMETNPDNSPVVQPLQQVFYLA